MPIRAIIGITVVAMVVWFIVTPSFTGPLSNESIEQTGAPELCVRGGGHLAATFVTNVFLPTDGKAWLSSLPYFTTKNHSHVVHQLDIWLAIMQKHLSPFGQMLGYRLVNMALAARSAVDDARSASTRRKQPNVVSIIGPYRSGTTLMAHLLSLDSQHVHSFPSWQLFRPVPETFTEHLWSREQHWHFDQFRLTHLLLCNGPHVMEQIARVHDIAGDFAEEEAILMFGALQLIPFVHLLGGEEFRRIVIENEQTTLDTYHYLANAVRAMAGHDDHRRILLKSPQHSYHPEMIPKTFPGAQVIVMQRAKLSEGVQSWATALLYILSIFDVYHLREFSLREYGLRIWNELKAMRKTLDAFLIDHKDDKNVQSIDFDTFTKEPVATIKKLYKSFGWNYTAQYESRLIDYLSLNTSSGSYGSTSGKSTVSYKLSHFGLTASIIDTAVLLVPTELIAAASLNH